MLGLLVAHVDPVRAPREEIDRWRAVEREDALVDERAQGPIRSRQRDDQLELVPSVARQCLLEADELQKPEALGKREVFMQKPVAAERPRRVRDQRLVPLEAHGLNRSPAEPREPGNRASGRPDEDAEPAPEDQLVELQRDLVATGEEQIQSVHRDLLEGVRRGRAQPQAEHGLDRLGKTERVERQIGRERRVSRLDDLDRPERQLVGRPELARRHLAAGNLPAQHRAPGYREARGERSLGHARRELDDRHGRGRREIVRIDALEEVLGEARELGVELETHAGRQETEPLEQPLDVRIGHLGRVERQARGDLGEGGGELRPHLPHVLQLLVVVAKHAGVHQRPSTTRISPLSRSMSVLIKNSSG